MDRIFEQQTNWRQIAGEGGFMIDENGFVYSKWIRPSKFCCKESWVESLHWHKIEISINKAYPSVGLRLRGRIRMHVLMLETFVGPKPDGMEACHKDDNTKNWCLSNLYWGTRRQNTLDRLKNNIFPGALDEESVIEIRERCAAGERQYEVAADFMVTRMVIWKIVNRRTWKHV